MTDTSHYDHILFQEKLRAAETESDFKLFSMLRPRLFLDGDRWCCLYGENIQEGLAGFGETPVGAVRQWNAAWYKVALAAERGE